MADRRLSWHCWIVLVIGFAAFSGAANAQQKNPPTQSPNDPGKSASPETLAEIKKIVDLNAKGQFREAEAAARDLLSRVEKTFGPDSLDAAKVLDVLSENMHNGGKAGDPETRSLIERSIFIKEKVLGPDDPETAWSLRNLATLLEMVGDYSTARPLFERVLAIQEKTLGPDHAQVGWTSVNFGMLLKDLGDYPAAKSSLERAIRIYERINRDTAVAIASNNLVDVLVRLRDYDGAKHCAERAWEIYRKKYGSDHPSTAVYQANLAGVQALMGDYASAKPLIESSLAVLKKTLGDEHPFVAELTDNLAECLYFTGDPIGAKQLYERASAIYEKTLGPDHPSFADHLVGFANFLAQRGEIIVAIDLALRAERIGEDHLRLTTRAFPERQALTYAEARVSGLDLMLTLVTQRPNETSAARPSAWDALIRGRASVLDEMAARHHLIGETGDVELARLAQELASARERLARLVVRGPENDTSEHYRSLVDEARQEREQAEQALAEKSLPFREQLDRNRIGLKEVVAALPADSALVAFVRYGRQELAEEKSPRKPPEPVPSYLAFVLRSGESDPTLVPLGKAEEIDAEVSRWREQVTQEALAAGRASQRSEAAYRRTAAELRRKVWDPISRHLQGTERVLLVPDGALHLVNFAALPSGKTKYVIETGPVIHYLSAERDLVPARSEAKNEGLLALGSPAFDERSLFAALAPEMKKREAAELVQLARVKTFRGSRSACAAFESMRFEPLPASARETKKIIALWRKTSGPQGGQTAQLRSPTRVAAGDVLYLSGAEATESAFKREAPGKRVLHLATHGFFLGGRCTSALEAKGEHMPVGAGENPLLLSGLALAGANYRQAAGEDEEDGILTAEEIASLDLNGVEWAVLSACNTGVGEVKAGEGVFGLRRAFQVAGVRTIIMSLWPVEDQAARQWMTTLYDGRFKKGLETAQAVHQASLNVLHQRRVKNQSTHPFYWASFVAAGDWR